MYDNYGVKGPVHILRQRKPRKLDSLLQITDLDSFDAEFSPIGQLLQETNYNTAGNPIGYDRFVYDDAGRAAQRIRLDGTGVEIDRSHFERQIDENGIVTTSRKPSGEFLGRTIEIYEGKLLLSFSSYDELNNVRRKKAFQYEGTRLLNSDSRYYIPDGSIVEQWLSDYDSESRIVSTYGLNSDGKPLGDGKYRYEYDSEGRQSKVWSYEDLSGDDIPNSVRVYEYSCDERENWIERREFHRFRDDSKWSYKITTRELTYYLVG